MTAVLDGVGSLHAKRGDMDAMDPYPNYRKGVRVALQAGMVVALVLTIPSLVVPVGDPAKGADLAAMLRRQWTWAPFWEEKVGIFLLFFFLTLPIGFIFGAFRPERRKS